ncbi:MAG: sulfotransferase [Actinomycetota bacterium]|nr:sulfotransferase [Actinomycetota bacterium]
MIPFIFLVGSGRSGTTLYRNILDGHTELAITHEAHVVAPLVRRRKRYEGAEFAVDRFIADLYGNPNFRRQGLDRAMVAGAVAAAAPATVADAVRAVFAAYAAAAGKSRYGDKTPGYVTSIAPLAAAFPESRFVHIIRDGRDVALGYLDRDEWGPSTVADAAFYWASRVGRGREAGVALGSRRYLETRYEDLVRDPEPEVGRLCDFLDLEYQSQMLRFHEQGATFIAGTRHPDAFTGLAQPITRGMRDWRTQMAPDDVLLFEAIAGDLLDDLGYERTGVPTSPSVRLHVAWARLGWERQRLASRLQPLAARARRAAGARR